MTDNVADEELEGTGDIHIVPLNDVHEHEISPDCECNPTWDDCVWIHHSWDRREERETKEAMQ